MSPSSGLFPRLREWSSTPVEVHLVVEIAADYVAGIRYEKGKALACRVEALPADAVRPAPLADNMADLSPVTETLGKVVHSIADGQRRCALIIPDLAARVGLVGLDNFPTKPSEADNLLRWRLKKDLPFDVNQAQLSYHVQPGHKGSQEVLTVTSLTSVVRQYEKCLEDSGLHAGHVTLSTLAALECIPSDQRKPTLLAKRDHASLSLAILQGGAIRLFRTMPMAPASVPQADGLFEKLYPAIVFFQDQWEERVADVVQIGLDEQQALLSGRLTQEAGAPMRSLHQDLTASADPGESELAADRRMVSAWGWVRGEAQ